MKLDSHQLLTNLDLLRDLIVRKPFDYTPEWAKTINDSFEKYTNTRTINLLQSMNNCLAGAGWPFPVFIDVEKELNLLQKQNHHSLISRISLFSYFGTPTIFSEILYSEMGGEKKEKLYGFFLRRRLRRNISVVFSDLSISPFFSQHMQQIKDLQLSYRNKMWSSLAVGVLCLADALFRGYFASSDLRTSVADLVRSLRKAGIAAEDMQPGFFCHNSTLSAECNEADDRLESDLRLVGVYLSSFIEFSERYYQWCDIATTTSLAGMNRHALIHGVGQHVTEDDAARLIIFLHLAVKLQRPLSILVRGSASI